MVSHMSHCTGGHLDVTRLLIENKADVDSQDNRKVSCLMAAFRKVTILLVDNDLMYSEYTMLGPYSRLLLRGLICSSVTKHKNLGKVLNKMKH